LDTALDCEADARTTHDLWRNLTVVLSYAAYGGDIFTLPLG